MEYDKTYFVIDTYIDPDKGRREYDEYIELVKPIVEAHNGKYNTPERSEKSPEDHNHQVPFEERTV